jgi:quinol monooxygenase YgiN
MDPASILAVVTCAIDLHFTPTSVDVAVPLLLSSVSRTEAKIGCRACTLAREVDEPNRVHYCETWNDEAAFRRHIQSLEFQRVLTAMDMCCEEPQVIIGHLLGHSGFSYLQELRESKESRAS